MARRPVLAPTASRRVCSRSRSSARARSSTAPARRRATFWFQVVETRGMVDQGKVIYSRWKAKVAAGATPASVMGLFALENSCWYTCWYQLLQGCPSL